MAKLLAIQEISLLRPKFYAYLDNKQWEQMGAMLAENAELSYQVADGTVYSASGRAAIVGMIQQFTSTTRTFHLATLADVQFRDLRNAETVWRVSAYFSAANAAGKVGIEFETVNETYVNVGGSWLITKLEAIVHESF